MIRFPLPLVTMGFAMAVVGYVHPLVAQTPEAPKSTITPEQMIEEALRRFDAGDFNEAAAYVQKVRAAKPELEKLKLVEGLLMLELQRKRSSEAITRFGEYNNSTEGKNDYRGNAALGKVFKDSRMYQQAIRPLEKAQKLAPADQDGKPMRALITMDLAECYYGMKRTKDAIATAKEAESMASNDSGIQLQLGRIAFNSKDYETAVRAADRGIGLLNAKVRADPFKPENLRNLQECAELKIKVFNSKIEANAKDGAAYADIAQALHEKADIEKRIELLKAREYGIRGIANDPKSYKLQVFVAGVEAELGGFQEALDRLNDVINNEPENQAAIKLRTEVQSRLAAGR